MAEAKDRAAWKRTALLAAVIAAPNRKDHRVKPRDYDPYEMSKKPINLPGPLPDNLTDEQAEQRYQEWRRRCQESE